MSTKFSNPLLVSRGVPGSQTHTHTQFLLLSWCQGRAGTPSDIRLDCRPCWVLNPLTYHVSRGETKEDLSFRLYPPEALRHIKRSLSLCSHYVSCCYRCAVFQSGSFRATHGWNVVSGRVCKCATDSAQNKNQQIQITEIRNAHKANRGSMRLVCAWQK